MSISASRTVPLTVTIPEDHENNAIIDVMDSLASVHATYVDRSSIYDIPETWRNACGFYILFSPIREDGAYTVYVGKSDKDFTKRMRSHDQNKEGWIVALLVQRKGVGGGLNSTQSSYLEGALRDLFASASHVQCQNIAGTGDWTLPEHEKVIMAQVVESTLRIMLLRGYRTVLTKKTMSTNAENKEILATQDISLSLYQADVAVPLTPSSAVSPSSNKPAGESRGLAFSMFGRKKTVPPILAPKIIDPEDVREALLDWRKEKSKELHTRYSFIIENYTINALVQKMPATYDALLEIPGIKEKKREQFGRSLLEVLDRFRS